MAMHKPKKQKRFQDGGDVGEAEMKQRGLDASNKEAPVGFFERLRMGNIDDPNSEAYKKFGAGRGRQDRDDTDFAAEEARDKTARAQAGKASDGDVSPYDLRTEAAANAPSRVSTSSGQSSSGSKPSAAPKVDVPASQKAKTAAEYSDATDAMRNRSRMAANSANKKSSTTDELRAKSRKAASNQNQKNDGVEVSAAQKYRDENQISPVLTGLLGLGAGFLARTPKGFVAKKLFEGGKKFLSNRAKQEAAKSTGSKAATTGAKSPLRQKTEQLIREDKNLGRSVSQAPAIPKVSLKEKTKELIQSDRTAKSREMSRQMAEKQTPTKFTSKKSTSTPKKLVSSKRAKKFNDDESKVEFKRGGRVGASSASKRADGIAQRGKTRGRVY